MSINDDLFAIEIGKSPMKTLKPAPEKITLPASRDKLHLELMNKLRLNRYDLRFMANIQEKYLCNGKPLSPGQNALYEKIVHKYRKQFRKLGARYTDVLALPWENGIVSVEVLNQKTYFRLAEKEDSEVEIQLYFNFNKTQIEEVRALVHDDKGNHLNRGADNNFGNGQKYNFNWNNTSKSWYGPFDVYLFKPLYEFAKRANLIIDKSVTDLITLLDAHGTKEDWTPSIHLVHGRIYVNHIAETMLPFLETIDPNDLSMFNIERTAKLGLCVPDSFAHIAPYLNSVSADTKHILTDSDDVAMLKDYIIESGRKVAFHIPEIVNPGRPSMSKLAELWECETWGDFKLYTDQISSYPTRYEQASNTETVDNLLEAGYNTLVTTQPLINLLRSQTEIGKFALEADKVIYIKLTETK